MRALPHGAKNIDVLRLSCASSGSVRNAQSCSSVWRQRTGWKILAFLAASLSGCNLASGNLNNQVGMWSYERGNYLAAREEFTRSVADEPRSPAFNYNLACALRCLGDSGGAAQAYWRAIQLDPSHEPSYHALARLLIEEGRRDEATQLISTWVDAQPRNAGAQIEMSWIERENGDPNAAEQSLFRALAARPNNPVATGQLGQLYEQMGQNDRAAVMYRRSLQADWFQPQVQARLALLQNRGGATEGPSTLYAINSGAPTLAGIPPVVASPIWAPVRTTVPPRLAGSPNNDDPAHLVD
jgi:Tfp pilus assembly protein PilF